MLSVLLFKCELPFGEQCCYDADPLWISKIAAIRLVRHPIGLIAA